MSDQYAVEGNDTSGYVGVDPCYQGYANETDKPVITEAEAVIVAKQEPDTDFVQAEKVSTEDTGATSEENGGGAPKTPAASPSTPSVPKV